MEQNTSKTVYFVMDPVEKINRKKDTTLAFMYEAFKRGYKVFTTEPRHLWIKRDLNQKAEVHALCQEINFQNDIENFQLSKQNQQSMHDGQFVFMRQDPPVTIEYITSTFILDILENDGIMVINHPSQVRGAKEKLTAMQFPSCAPSTVISSQKEQFRDFLADKKDIVIKPLDGMGGQGIFRIKEGDQNLDSVIETLTFNGQIQIMAQQYIPEIVDGDKRILMINGEPVPYALARVPQKGALRGNLAAGGQGVGKELSARDREICEIVGPWLKAHNIYFAGLDVIGDYLTEVNVTSPTCVRELDKIYNLNISGQLFDALEKINQT